MTNNLTVIKSKKTTDKELEQINKFTTRKFTADELYTFSVILCDNEIDRDFEQFPSESLHKLKELFVGKTGIFDHNPKGENQTARIYSTQVIKDQTRQNQLGEPYEYLLAKAYMIKSEKNKNLILEVEGGIKKEVSIGCSVGRKVCGVCGADISKTPCDHKKGKQYGNMNGVAAYTKLLDPTDAYEFSFVAIPAQRKAGVTKKFQKDSNRAFSSAEYKQFLKEKRDFENTLRQNKSYIEAGKTYIAAQKKNFVTQVLLKNTGANTELLQTICEKLTLEELEELKKCLGTNANPASQFLVEHSEEKAVVDQFKV